MHHRTFRMRGRDIGMASFAMFDCRLQLLDPFIKMGVLYSCKKYPGPSQPVATLTSPSDTAIINAGDTISLKGTVSDNKSLHEVFFRLSDSANDSILFFDNPYTHGTQARNYSYAWITSLPGSYKWIVEVQDHDRHTTIQEFPIVVH